MKLNGTVQEITERKLADLSLQESEEKWRSLFEIIPVGVSIVDQNNNLLDFNPSLSQILDITNIGLEKGEYKNRKYLHADNSIMSPDEFPSICSIRIRKLSGI